MSDTEKHLKLQIDLSGDALGHLENAKKNLNVTTPHAIGNSFALMNILSRQAKDGFTEIVVRNPQTRMERILNVGVRGIKQ